MVTLIASVLLIIGMYLIAENNIWNWPVNIAGSAILVIYFAIQGEIWLLLFNVIVIILCIKGWLQWGKR